MSKRMKDWLEAVCYAAAILVILYFACWPYQVADGRSMEPNFHTNDRVAVSRVLLYLNRLKTGDVVVCKFPGADEEGRKSIIKRVIGLPGDHVVISDGKVYLNGVEWFEPYLGNTTVTGSLDIILREDEYFLLGDNREASTDSRHFGVIGRKDMVGKVIVKWFPFQSFQIYRNIL